MAPAGGCKLSRACSTANELGRKGDSSALSSKPPPGALSKSYCGGMLALLVAWRVLPAGSCAVASAAAGVVVSFLEATGERKSNGSDRTVLVGGLSVGWWLVASDGVAGTALGMAEELVVAVKSILLGAIDGRAPATGVCSAGTESAPEAASGVADTMGDNTGSGMIDCRSVALVTPETLLSLGCRCEPAIPSAARLTRGCACTGESTSPSVPSCCDCGNVAVFASDARGAAAFVAPLGTAGRSAPGLWKRTAYTGFVPCAASSSAARAHIRKSHRCVEPELAPVATWMPLDMKAELVSGASVRSSFTTLSEMTYHG